MVVVAVAVVVAVVAVAAAVAAAAAVWRIRPSHAPSSVCTHVYKKVGRWKPPHTMYDHRGSLPVLGSFPIIVIPVCILNSIATTPLAIETYASRKNATPRDAASSSGVMA